jgi:uncharacterized protein
MSISMYDLTVPPLRRGFERLSNYLHLAREFAADNHIDPQLLVSARLAPDMHSLSGQVQRASDTAKFAIKRLARIEVPRYDDSENSLEELQDRIDKTVALIDAVAQEKFDGSDERVVEMKFFTYTFTLRGDNFVQSFLLPNFYFHLATAHAILRHRGLPIGKMDYIGPLE